MGRQPQEDARPFLPPERDIESLRVAAAGCTACDLHERGTQTVFGAGAPDAKVMFVGEQPGDAEDLAGQPFIGPAGRLLDRALADAGIERGRVYVTNAVKHFKWEPRGKRRLHAKPNAREMRACQPWLEAEIAAVRPLIVVALGATAAQALAGPEFRLTAGRGRFVRSRFGPWMLATLHPSAVLRRPDSAARQVEFAGLVADLGKVARVLAKGEGALRELEREER